MTATARNNQAPQACTLDDCGRPAVFEIAAQGQLPAVFACRIHEQMTRNGLGLLERLFGLHPKSRSLPAGEFKESA